LNALQVLIKIGYVGAALSLNVGAALLLTEVRVLACDLCRWSELCRGRH
jgi:hypothetical protein